MSHRRETDHHCQQLREIRDIMDSMKTLAYMETHKLFKFINAQNTLVQNIETIAADFLYFNPDVLPTVEPAVTVHLLIGSQRGFCGDFNEMLIRRLELTRDNSGQHQCKLIAIGQKLHPLLKDIPFDIVYIEGANVTEEISRVVSNIANTLSVNQRQLMSLYVLHHAEDGGICSERLLPPFKQLRKSTEQFSHPPLLNMPAEIFFLELTERYLFINLHRLLFASLMAESQSRILHLNNAINHLDNRTSELIRKSNALRQEEIIEEIEVILLNASRQ